MKTLRAIVIVLLVCQVVSVPVLARAAHDTKRMELEGNASNGGASGGDWASVMPNGTSGDIVATFIKDAEPADASYFTGGGSKDTNDVSQWATTTGDVAPDKNQITNAYAIAFRSAIDTGRTDVGDLLIYFGADRFANDGDAQMGFWFFRDRVGIAGSGFTGAHSKSDILVLAHFTNGGRVSTADVFRWVGSGGSHDSLDLIASGAECSGSLDDDRVCSVANEAAVSSPWAYIPKQGSSGSFPENSFYEGGLNLSRIAPGVECFSSMLAETRSSASTDAQLKDLALGDFDTCPARRRAPSSSTNTLRGRPSGPRLALSGPGADERIAIIGAFLLIAGAAMRRRARRACAS